MNRKMAFISGISGVKRDGEMKKNMLVFWICLLLGILSVIYAVMVHATGSGTAFFLIWIGIGIVVFLFGISVYMEVWKKVPHPVERRMVVSRSRFNVPACSSGVSVAAAQLLSGMEAALMHS